MNTVLCRLCYKCEGVGVWYTRKLCHFRTLCILSVWVWAMLCRCAGVGKEIFVVNIFKIFLRSVDCLHFEIKLIVYILKVS